MHLGVRAVALAIALVFCVPLCASAHPLGNFTVNHLTRLTFGASGVDLTYVLDQAEIPSFTLLRSLAADGRPSDERLASWAVAFAQQTRDQLVLSVDGGEVPLALAAPPSIVRRPGAGGLLTTYLRATYHAAISPGAHRIAFADHTFADRIGWKDIVVSPASEPTDELRRYPSALIGSPRDRTSIAATLDARGHLSVANTDEGMSAAPSAARMNALSDELDRNYRDPLVAVVALLLAIALGALHALEPGHGKSLLAITLVGARATVSQAAILAGSLTIAHTAGVLAFGVVLLCFARFIVPEMLYPWMALGSGAVVVVIGARAVLRSITARRATAHDHGHSHRHDHDHDHAHDHGHAHEHPHTHAIAGTAPLRFGSAVAAAMAGNIAPCPAALVVLLAAVATHRIAIGMLLIVAFSLGLALTLTLLGFAVVRGAGWLMQRRGFDRIGRAAPLVSALAMCAAGAWMIATSTLSLAAISGVLLAGLVLVAGPSLVRRFAVRTPIGGVPS